MKFRDICNQSIDFDFFNGEIFAYVLLFVLYQRRYHAVTNFEKNFQKLFWNLEEFSQTFEDFTVFDAVWDFIVLDKTPRDF